MKKFKSGFTLAEVLITLGIIGVIAAVVMPTVMTNHTYKTVGVKLQKFASQLEGSARPYVVSNENFAFVDDDENAALNIRDYILNSFILLNKEDVEDDEIGDEAQTSRLEFDDGATIYELKDGTSFTAYTLDEDFAESEEIDTRQVGEVVFGIAFAPTVNGMTKKAQKIYRYVVTELGYVYPDSGNDACIATLADANYAAKATHYLEDQACDVPADDPNFAAAE